MTDARVCAFVYVCANNLPKANQWTIQESNLLSLYCEFYVFLLLATWLNDGLIIQ